jgi:molybdopterin molybdotransferase
MQERVVGFAAAVAEVERQGELLPARDTEQLGIGAALGRVLAGALLADRDFPPFARSTRDGFAVASEFVLQQLRIQLRLLGEVRAGARWTGSPVAAGSCVEIMTGAPLPAGADAVVMVEHVERQGDGSIVVPAERWPSAGTNVVAAGSEARRGETVVADGTRLEARHLGMAGACGAAELQVYRRPRIAVLATGDELVDVGEAPGPEQIRNSNSYALAAAVSRSGGDAVILPVARDTVENLRAQMTAAFECDLAVFAGGVSAGKYDLAEKVLSEEFGAEFFFTGVKMQPGRPVVFGKTAAGKYFFGLPGNPVSALVTFGLLARPLVAAMSGERGWKPQFALARLADELKMAAGLTRFLPAQLESNLRGASAPEVSVRRVRWQGSGDMAALARANSYLVVPESGCDWRAGELVPIWTGE